VQRVDSIHDDDDDVRAHVPGDVGGGNALHDELGSGLSLGLVDVRRTEEELAVEVGDVDGVEVDDMDVGEADEREVLEQLAAETAGADDQDGLGELGLGSLERRHKVLDGLGRCATKNRRQRNVVFDLHWGGCEGGCEGTRGERGERGEERPICAASEGNQDK